MAERRDQKTSTKFLQRDFKSRDKQARRGRMQLTLSFWRGVNLRSHIPERSVYPDLLHYILRYHRSRQHSKVVFDGSEPWKSWLIQFSIIQPSVRALRASLIVSHPVRLNSLILYSCIMNIFQRESVNTPDSKNSKQINKTCRNVLYWYSSISALLS